nr:PREDICTED: uncharacterized protein LOC107399276 [Tribolium castaneum]|eukprot:XP_015840908.1 PREDICTED: uncharacterized protein LOC107399276 [Tribolium castaneum]
MHETIVKLLFPLSCLVFLSVIVASNGANSEYKHRTKRKVVFSKSSKFFVRLNGKDNMLNYTEIFAHGWTFRINYDLPETIPKRHQFFKRDVHAELDGVADESLRGVYSCILKYVCERVSEVQAAPECGIFCGIGNIILSSLTAESEFFQAFVNKCEHHASNCPYVYKDAKFVYQPEL